MDKKHDFSNFKKVGNLLDSVLGSAISVATSGIFLWVVIIVPLAFLAHCGIIPGAVEK